VNAELLRNSLKLAVAAMITAAIAVHFDRIAFAWYPLLAVVIVVDDNDDQTLKAASGRMLGTLMGGLVTFLVHAIAGGWQGVLLTLLLLVPLLLLTGCQSALGTAGVIVVMFLMIPGHAALNWDYAFNRALDTAVGCAVALAVGLLFWPRDGLQQLAAAEAGLLRQLRAQLQRYRLWLAGEGPRPGPLPAAPISGGLERMETLLRNELGGPRWRRLQAGGWQERVALWQNLRLHWLQWERLIAAGDLPRPRPGQGDPLADGIQALAAQLDGAAAQRAGAAAGPPPPVGSEPWKRLAAQSGRPLFTLLAIAQEQRPLLETGEALARLQGAAPCR